MSVEINLKGKTALITGGTLGIGAAIAKLFHEAGAELILTGFEAQEDIDKLNADNRKKGIDNITYVRVDFTKTESIERFFDFLDKYDRIDICVNNAGTNRNNLIDETLVEDYDYLTDLNLKAPFLVTRFVSKKMKQNKYGRIVNIASIWSTVGRSGRTVYSITKAGVLGLTRTTAVELAEYNILVNAVSPGFTLTELTKNTISEKDYQELPLLVPARRFAQPEDIAKTVLFLCSDLNNYIVGQNLIVDGGFTNV